jgi:hypothetical protein
MLLRLLLWPFRRLQRRAGPPAAAPSQAGLTLEQYEALFPSVTITEGTTDVTYCTPNRTTCCGWKPCIRTCQDGDVLVDIGTNVGRYAIFAAKTRARRSMHSSPSRRKFRSII